MNSHTREFLTKLSSLLEEYKANLEIEGDRYSGGPMQITLEVLNPQTFHEHHDQWLAEHPGEKYPYESHVLYSYAEWVDLGYHVNADKVKGLLK